MKRTMSMALIIGLFATAASAAAVTSENTVGYKTVSLTGLDMLGLNFEQIAGGSIPINDLVSGETPGLTQGADASTADNIQILVGGSYVTYYLSNGTIGKITDPALAGKWIKFGESTATADVLESGDGFWYVARSATPASPVDVTLAGQVPDTLVAPITLGALTQIANPFSTPMPYNSVEANFTNAIQGADSGTADNIQVLSGGSYVTYYCSNGTIGKITDPALAGKWIKFGESVATTDELPMGEGAWYVNRGADKPWTPLSPYTL